MHLWSIVVLPRYRYTPYRYIYTWKLQVGGTSTPPRYSTPTVRGTATPSRYNHSTRQHHCTPTRYNYTCKVQLHLYTTMYIYTSEVYQNLGGTAIYVLQDTSTPTMCIFIFLEAVINTISEVVRKYGASTSTSDVPVRFYPLTINSWNYLKIFSLQTKKILRTVKSNGI